MAGSDEGREEVIANIAGRLFDGLPHLGGTLGNAGAVNVQGNIEPRAEGFDKLLVDIGLDGPDAVVDVGGTEADAERVVLC